MSDDRRSPVGRRGFRLGIGALVPVGIGWLDGRTLGQALLLVEAVIAIAVLAAAMFGSNTISERAFRVLRWVADRPEPPAPRA